MNVRRILMRVFPALDLIDAGLDLIEDPSIRRVKRVISTYRRLIR